MLYFFIFVLHHQYISHMLGVVFFIYILINSYLPIKIKYMSTILFWQLRDDLMTMLIAGHETTAAVLTWAVFLLAQVWFFITNFWYSIVSFMKMGSQYMLFHDFYQWLFSSRKDDATMLMHFDFLNCRTPPKWKKLKQRLIQCLARGDQPLNWLKNWRRSLIGTFMNWFYSPVALCWKSLCIGAHIKYALAYNNNETSRCSNISLSL